MDSPSPVIRPTVKFGNPSAVLIGLNDIQCGAFAAALLKFLQWRIAIAYVQRPDLQRMWWYEGIAMEAVS